VKGAAITEMVLRPGEALSSAIAVFPFLKTREPISLGRFTFRSTEDTADLSEQDSARVAEVAEMLFLQDDLRIRSASYAMLSPLNLDADEKCLRELERVQAIVAYCYSGPRQTFGDLFFHFEQASLAIFSPEPVSIFLVRPEHHVVTTDDNRTLAPDQFHRVLGYQGRYNFRHPFWVAKGSRLYPPVPHLSLNDSQDLAWDLRTMLDQQSKHHLLRRFLRERLTPTAARALTGVVWYNRANSLSNDEAAAILDLAVGFEALLSLPKEAKTDRFIDAVSLLLGHVDRLDRWAGQFYGARSEVAHEGNARQSRFLPARYKNSEAAQLYQSLLTYGRQIFQLCVSAVLFGDRLADESGLQDKLVTNQERFESICKTLDQNDVSVGDRFEAIDTSVASINEFRYVPETNLSIDTMIGALQRAASMLLAAGDSADSVVGQQIKRLANAKSRVVSVNW
jgi:hypothetical protein